MTIITEREREVSINVLQQSKWTMFEYSVLPLTSWVSILKTLLGGIQDLLFIQQILIELLLFGKIALREPSFWMNLCKALNLCFSHSFKLVTLGHKRLMTVLFLMNLLHTINFRIFPQFQTFCHFLIDNMHDRYYVLTPISSSVFVSFLILWS